MDYSILVNKDNKIKNNYYKDLKLVNTKDIENADIQVEEKAYEILRRFNAIDETISSIELIDNPSDESLY